MNSILLFLVMTSNPTQELRALEIRIRIEPTREDLYQLGIHSLQADDYNRALTAFGMIPEHDDRRYYYLGVTHYRLGNLDRAQVCFELAHRRTPSFHPPLIYLGLIELEKNHLPEARQYLEAIAGLDPWRDSLQDLLDDYDRLGQARSAYEQDERDEAVRRYASVVNFFGYREIGLALAYKRNGETDRSILLLDTVIGASQEPLLVNRALFEAGRIDIDRKDYRRARSRLNRCLTGPDDHEIRFLMGLTYSNENRYDSAAFYFQGLPDSVDRYLFFHGRNDYFRGQWGLAEEKLLRHREFFPRSDYADRAIFILGSIDYKRKEYGNAIRYWDELIKDYPGSEYQAVAAKNRADARFNLKDYSAALEAYETIGDHKPPVLLAAECRLREYECRFFLRHYPSLIAALRAFIEENPGSPVTPRTRLRVAKILCDQKEYYSSLAELDNLLETSDDRPTRRDALIERARIASKIGDRAEVKVSYRQILTEIEAPEDISFALNELGHMYSAESRYDSALIYYQRLLGFEKYREMTLLEIAKIYDQLGQTREAGLTADNLIREFPESVFLVEAALLKVKALRRAGNYKQALDDLTVLIDQSDADPRLYFEIGDICSEIHDFERARDAFLKACDLFRQNRDDAAQALLRAGEAAQALGNKAQAREYYTRATLIAESLTLKNQASYKLTHVED